MNNEAPTAVEIAEDLTHTRRDVDVELKISNLDKGQISSVRQYIKTRLLVLLNRLNVLEAQEATKGNGPKNYEFDSRNITKEIHLLGKIPPYLGIDDNQSN